MIFNVPGKHEENSPTIRDINCYLTPMILDLSMYGYDKTHIDQKMNDIESRINSTTVKIWDYDKLKEENDDLKKTMKDLIMFLQFKEVLKEEELKKFFEAQAVAEKLKKSGMPKEDMPPNEVNGFAINKPSQLECLVSEIMNEEFNKI
jgi:ASC-1-like (ASCH) protein